MEPPLPAGLADVHPAAYRIAFKLRSLQKLCQLHLVDSSMIVQLLKDLRSHVHPDGAVPTVVTMPALQLLFQRAQVTPGAAEHTSHLLAAMFDRDQAGSFPLRSVAVALVALSADQVSIKFAGLFELAVQASGHPCADDRRATRHGLRNVLQDLQQIPRIVQEDAGLEEVDVAIRDCFQGELTSGIVEEKFACWLHTDPPCVRWLPTLYRVSTSETVVHQSRCQVCRSGPIVGLRYQCLRCVNFNLCQSCYLTCRTDGRHRLSHPTLEFCRPPSTKESLKVFSWTLRTLLGGRHKRTGTRNGMMPKMGTRPGVAEQRRPGAHFYPGDLKPAVKTLVGDGHSKAVHEESALEGWQWSLEPQPPVWRSKRALSDPDMRQPLAAMQDVPVVCRELTRWRSMAAVELNIQEELHQRLEAHIDVLTEHNETLQAQLGHVRQLLQMTLVDTGNLDGRHPENSRGQLTFTGTEEHAGIEQEVNWKQSMPSGSGQGEYQPGIGGMDGREVTCSADPYASLKMELLDAAELLGHSLCHLVDKATLPPS
ncbi:dystrotelin [Polypterus senegalus]|uniref:dystrotelin n=1 Tax=Polypterus senegalus TaxID=55291 RepID=UPI001964CB7E|nr:dystrotelin [Polypterus senegalus]